jgi:methionyl-tRNA formyltransferase
MKPLKIIFAGTPEFSLPALKALFHSVHTIAAVYTQPDRPAGRGRKLTASPVKQFAQENNLPVYQPETLRDEAQQKILQGLNADVMVVVAYGLLLPPAVLAMPRFGCINIHPSLLPRWRGAAPIQRTILAGDEMTGVTIMQMEAGLDSGPMLFQQASPLATDETSDSLHARLSAQGAIDLLHTLQLLQENKLQPIIQDESLVTYAKKITKEEASIDWQATAVELARKVRAFNSWPVAYTRLGADTLRIWQAQALAETTSASPGTILEFSRAGLKVATGDGVLLVQMCQLPGGRAQSVADFFNAHQTDFVVGKMLGTAS